ncbi:abortive infection family protein [Chitinophaga oryzae]|uniref:Abortive infection family protein n=2 Tax=Chitinophaga oryzae TaxID=2725414 RepID=A0AAE7DBK2_9BACT|nr:abortive infection family protein [Chitinophaga oryzae]QJB42766.1 abortive infection family protein [Chitinophaga oryzae]
MGIATNGQSNGEEYIAARSSLLRKSSIKGDLPDFVKENRTLNDFWQYIKHKFPSYQERRNFINEGFKPVLGKLEERTPIVETTIRIDDLYIRDIWQKALVRMNEDPEAAITSARTLLETVCKHIVDKMNVEYDDTIDLPKLYKLTATNLNLSPDQHTEKIFKQILNGCQSIIEGLGSMRNKLSDAHGKSQKRAKPSPRHAALAVNLAGSMCQFLLQTYDTKMATVG